ncbi:MAG: type VI secretion system-associated FHA domain protein TagH [Steroidobacteraceae bacterium]
MALRLEIISQQREQLGSRASILLGASGGSIGRALDNDWSLPDPQRYLSGHHARILLRQGSYFLEDTSTNGVYVNDSSTPQGRRGLHALQPGDVLRMGDYRVLVHIDDDAPPVPQPVPGPGTNTLAQLGVTPGTNTLAQMAVDNVVPLRAMAAQDLGASLNIEALIPPDATGPMAKLQAAGLRGTASAPHPSEHRLTRLRAAARARLEGNATPLVDVRNGMEAFCRGAGLDPAQVPMGSEAASLHLAGRLLREALIGLKEILRAQQLFRDRHGIASQAAEGRSPLDATSDEFLLELLNGHEKRRLDAVMQLRGRFEEAGADASAMDPALRGAFAQFMAHLAPGKMEAGTGPAAAAASWARYKEIYGTLLQGTGEQMPHLFLEALAQAYANARRQEKD